MSYKNNDFDDEKEIEEKLRTLIAMRVPESRIRFYKDIGTFILILMSMAVGFCLLGAAQYWACTTRWPDKTFSQCMRFDIDDKKGRR